MTNTLPHADNLSPVAAAGVVCFKQDAVLLVRRGQPPKKGEWSLPGGRIEVGEAAKTAALRELREETNIEAEILGLVDVVDAIFTNRAGDLLTRHYLIVDYLARWTGGEVQAGDDAADARFFTRAALEEVTIWDETRRVIDAAWGQYTTRQDVT